ncbi:hypothetical protein DCAR_0312225 [Daucus carota subsp. sativus]|uniref:DUF7054 domain-containing protein n=1 Tax=Daucus carota subsp. sativus TaxID=79200 RepID=A0A166AVW8_DAUCS|nr:PREDICTED: uncharacterized protein LOC108213707 isoform X2 [Daucus carota subsp. sativus]WOG92947.1 hypothetical protein DCAR_0312225 [Daucus carota subsp. sativus]
MVLRFLSEKFRLFSQNQKEKSSAVPGREKRFLIIVNVLGSSGPIKMVVKEDDSVAAVIRAALKLYAREERLPVLGYDVNKCLLYPSHGEQNALSPNEVIAAGGGRNFLLCKKQNHRESADDVMRSSEMTALKKTSCWKTLLIKPFRNIKSLVRTRC